MTRLLTAVLALTSFTGCVTAFDQSVMVMRRAEFDLACESGRLSVREIAPNAYGAEGCGQRAAYVVLCPSFMVFSCTALLDNGRSAIQLAPTH